ncbi:MAG: hypothetical protein GY737_10875 [Desulfobacteraceae bacterium]|nr:hypothetical protein [Desulfobacteraceae bacterium]
MKHLFFILGCVLSMAVPCLGKAPFPIHLGGFVLGEDISGHRKRIKMNSCRPRRYMEFIGEGEIQPIAGFKSGLIAFGACDRPNKIVRIKLKYADSSKGFFKELMDRFEERFGPPSEYLGDPFQILIAWKWAFEDDKGGRISLILQHNTKATEEKIGNAVKLSLTSQIDRERDCFKAKHPKAGGRKAKKGKTRKMWRLFVPY